MPDVLANPFGLAAPCWRWLEFDLGDDLAKAAQKLASGKGLGRVIAIGSTEHEDQDGETLVQKGGNWAPFLSHGKLTIEHPAGVFNIVGEPVGIEPCIEKGKPATKVIADLFLADIAGRRAYEKAVALKKSGARTRLGVSIEGNADERDPENAKRILRWTVHNLAVTSAPRNLGCTFDPIMASLMAGAVGVPLHGQAYTGGDGASGELAPLMTQTSGSPARRKLLKDMTDEDCAVAAMCRQFPNLTWKEATERLFGALTKKRAA